MIITQELIDANTKIISEDEAREFKSSLISNLNMIIDNLPKLLDAELFKLINAAKEEVENRGFSHLHDLERKVLKFDKDTEPPGEPSDIGRQVIEYNSWLKEETRGLYVPTDTNELPIDIVSEQSNDERLWFDERTAREVYLQHELRRLHQAIEESNEGGMK